MIMIDADDLDWMEKDWTIEKKIEWILANGYPHRKKFRMDESVRRILEVFEDEKRRKNE